MSRKHLIVAAFVIGSTVAARADLIQTFAGFDAVWETGVSGLKSSYYLDTRNAVPYSGPTVANALPTFGPQRVSYPGVGEVPSPGGAVGRHFDEGVLGVKVDAGNLVVQIANGLDPVTGYYHDGFQAWYGQGDAFIDVADNTGIRHYALLNTWPRAASGAPLALDGGHFNGALAFHVSGGAGGGSLEGHLVQLGADADITLSGGTGSYNAGNAPDGLDLRTFAAGGIDRANGGLTHAMLNDLGQTWYVQTWTIGLSSLSPDPSFNIGLHAITSCGNDQIGGAFTAVPEPASLALLLSGIGVIWRLRRVS